MRQSVGVDREDFVQVQLLKLRQLGEMDQAVIRDSRKRGKIEDFQSLDLRDFCKPFVRDGCSFELKNLQF